MSLCSKKRKTEVETYSREQHAAGMGVYRGKFIDCNVHLSQRGLYKSVFIVDANSHPSFLCSIVAYPLAGIGFHGRPDNYEQAGKSVQNRQNNYSRCIGSMLNETTSCVTSHASQFHRRCRINYDPTLAVTRSRPSVANYNYTRPCRGSRPTISSVLQTRVQLTVPSWKVLKEIWLFFVTYSSWFHVSNL